MLSSLADSRVRLFAAAVTVVGTALAPLTLPSAARAQEVTSSLSVTLDTGAPTAPAASAPESSAPAATPDNAPAASAAAPPPASREATPLASRSFTAPSTRASYRTAPSSAPRVLAQLGMVAVPRLSLRIERDPNSRLLSSVPQGTYLAVVADGGAWWGVLMVNNTMGWAPKSALQMIAYQTEIAVPSDPLKASAAQSAQTADNGAAGTVGGGVGETLDPRTTALLREAMTYLGVPYVWAGNTRAGLDCSGFVKAVFASQGIKLPRHSGDQAQVGQAVAGTDIRPGDRLYFDMGRKGEISHCGIYLGNGYFIHASTNHGHVDIDSVFKPNYYRALVAIRRS